MVQPNLRLLAALILPFIVFGKVIIFMVNRQVKITTSTAYTCQLSFIIYVCKYVYIYIDILCTHSCYSSPWDDELRYQPPQIAHVKDRSKEKGGRNSAWSAGESAWSFLLLPHLRKGRNEGILLVPCFSVLKNRLVTMLYSGALA